MLEITLKMVLSGLTFVEVGLGGRLNRRQSLACGDQRCQPQDGRHRRCVCVHAAGRFSGTRLGLERSGATRRSAAVSAYRHTGGGEGTEVLPPPPRPKGVGEGQAHS